MKFLKPLGVALMLTACSPDIGFYANQSPKMDIKTYFSGNIKAWGIAQDWRGRVVNSFDIDMVGTWEGDKGTLSEKFDFYDGKKQNRVWNITKLADGTYQGTAADILGKATGETRGNAARWAYTMDLPVDDTTYRVKFDDWMWQMNDGVLINRSYIKKFGITVSELTIFMQKQK
jgi:hypothetical protein